MSNRARKPKGSPASTGGEYDGKGNAGGGDLPALGAPSGAKPESAYTFDSNGDLDVGGYAAHIDGDKVTFSWADGTMSQTYGTQTLLDTVDDDRPSYMQRGLTLDGGTGDAISAEQLGDVRTAIRRHAGRKASAAAASDSEGGAGCRGRYQPEHRIDARIAAGAEEKSGGQLDRSAGATDFSRSAHLTLDANGHTTIARGKAGSADREREERERGHGADPGIRGEGFSFGER
jgi:hypothetical protein